MQRRYTLGDELLSQPNPIFPSRLGKRVVSICGMGDHKWIVVQLQVDILHNVSDGLIQSHKPLILYVGEDSNAEIVVLARPFRVGREQIHLNPVADLPLRGGQFFEGVRFGAVFMAAES